MIKRYVLIDLEEKAESRISVFLSKEDAEKAAKENGYDHYFVSEITINLTEREMTDLEDNRIVAWMMAEIKSRVSLGDDDHAPDDEAALEMARHAYGLYCSVEVTSDGFKMDGCTQGECIDQAVIDYCRAHDIDSWKV